MVQTTVFHKENIQILMWNTYFGNNFNFGDTHFNCCPAPFNRCQITINRSVLEESDAIIFHIPDLNFTSDMPIFRSPEQRWVFCNWETPANYPLKFYNEEAIKYLPQHYWFNWTFSYRYINDNLIFISSLHIKVKLMSIV